MHGRLKRRDADQRSLVDRALAAERSADAARRAAADAAAERDARPPAKALAALEGEVARLRALLDVDDDHGDPERTSSKRGVSRAFEAVGALLRTAARVLLCLHAPCRFGPRAADDQ